MLISCDDVVWTGVSYLLHGGLSYWFKSYMQVVFEGDSLITLAAMNRQEDDNDIRAFLQAFSQPKFNHVRREANQVAHRLLLVQELGGNRRCLGSRNHRIWPQTFWARIAPFDFNLLIDCIFIEDS